MTTAWRLPIALSLALSATQAGLAGQGVQELAGAWNVDCARWGSRDASPGGFPVTFVVRTSAAEVTIVRNGGPVETYRLDGTPTQLPDGRQGIAAIEGGALTVTITRTRQQGDDGPYLTTTRDVYRASGDLLTIERQSFGQRPGEPKGPGSVVQTVIYRKNAQ